MKDKKIFLKIFLIISLLVLPGKSFALTDAQSAFYNSGQANNIISNDFFVDVNSMSVQDIQSFLEKNNSYLKGYVDNSDAGKGRSAAQIIWDAAHGKYEAGGNYNGITINESTGTINPRLILVYLQKEQSLISRTDWNDWAMLASMGYFCYTNFGKDNPEKDLDNNNCHDSYQGFTKQVENGAWQLRYNYERASGTGFSDYQVGQNITTEDGFAINLSNRATSAVYRYTPYVYFSAYNVWNLFYNVYDFDTSTGTTPSVPSDSVNDTSAWSRTTYGSRIQLSGSKAQNTRAYLNDNLIADLNLTSWSINIDAPIGNSNYAIIYKDTNNNEVARKTLQFARKKTADANDDGSVDSTDLSILADSWGKGVSSETAGDLNGDSVVDSTDLSILADAWGK